MVVEFCNLKLGSAALLEGCRRLDPSLDDARGFYTILRPRPKNTVLAERDNNVSFTPKPDPLISPTLGEENFEPLVGRLISGDAKLLTTDANWPLAGCLPNIHQGASCRLAFLIGGIAVESSWNNKGGQPTQAELWRIATQLDAKIRAFITFAHA
jgi:hypothetical protein